MSSAGPASASCLPAIRCPRTAATTLVPIRQERSVDLDLLEDASRNIEAFLRQQGYRAAEAPYVREERGGEMVLTFTVTRGPAASPLVARGRRQQGAVAAPSLRRSCR